MISDSMMSMIQKTLNSSTRDAALEPADQRVLRQIPPNEHEPRFADLVRSPGPAGIGGHHHVNSLEHDAVIKPDERHDTLIAHEVARVRGDRVTEEGLQPRRIERPRAHKRERLHRIVVLVVVLVEEAGLDLQNAVKRKAANVDDLGNRRLAEMHRLDGRARVDPHQAAAQARELIGADEVSTGLPEPVLSNKQNKIVLHHKGAAITPKGFDRCHCTSLLNAHSIYGVCPD
jgi:hypothetical protein